MNKPCARCGVMMMNVHHLRRFCLTCSSNMNSDRAMRQFQQRTKSRNNEHPVGYPAYILAYLEEWARRQTPKKADYVSSGCGCPSAKKQNKIGIAA